MSSSPWPWCVQGDCRSTRSLAVEVLSSAVAVVAVVAAVAAVVAADTADTADTDVVALCFVSTGHAEHARVCRMAAAHPGDCVPRKAVGPG